MHDTNTLRQDGMGGRRALAFVMRTTATLLALLALSPATGFAHGGGLDRQGCHRETATGGYHCHRDEDNEHKKNMRTGLAVLGGLGAAALVIHMITPSDGAARFGAVREAPKWRVRTEALAGRFGIATERAVAPRLWLGIWAAAAAGEAGAPLMIFGRLRF